MAIASFHSIGAIIVRPKGMGSDPSQHIQKVFVESRRKRAINTIVRGWKQFLWLPTTIVGGFIVLAIFTYALDRFDLFGSEHIAAFLKKHLFREAQPTSDLLGQMGASIVSVTSITFSVLLLAVQQAANALSSQVYEQFIRRKLNHIFFGFFIGSALYTFLTLATVHENFVPAFGATVSLLLSSVSLVFLIALVYTTVAQMRPEVVVEAIHDYGLRAFRKHERLLRRTRRTRVSEEPLYERVECKDHGFLDDIDLDRLERALAESARDTEIVFTAHIGDFVPYKSELARVYSKDPASRFAGVHAVSHAVRIERSRQIGTDPSFSAYQLQELAYPSLTSAKQTPATGLHAVYRLHNLFIAWQAQSEQDKKENVDRLRVVYNSDPSEQILIALANLIIAVTEARQSESLTQIFIAFAGLIENAHDHSLRSIERHLLPPLALIQHHVITAELEHSIRRLADTAKSRGLLLVHDRLHQELTTRYKSQLEGKW